MSDYQRKYPRRYRLPREVYYQTLWAIRDYNRLRSEAECVIEESPPPPDGQPKGSGVGDPVAMKAAKREEMLKKVNIIKGSLDDVVPPEYRHGVWMNILYGQSYPLDASRNTYGAWKTRYIFEVAKRLELI